MTEARPIEPPPGAEPEAESTKTETAAEPKASRRAVLLGAGAVIAAAGAGAGGMRSWTNGVWSVGTGAPYDLWRRWADQPGLNAIAAAGVLAANPHNMQPWRYEVRERQIKLFADPSRAMPINDADQRERLTGFGCAIENMVCAARGRGLSTQVDLPSSANGPVATLTMTPGPPASPDEERLARSISVRHSNRGPYQNRAVDITALLTAAGPGVPGADVTWVTQPEARAGLGALFVEATEAIVADEDMSIEAFSWLRSDRSSLDRHRDGLTLDCQGLSPLMLAVAKIVPAQSRADGNAFWVKAVREVHTATAAAYGIITVADNRNTADRITGGRLLQRLQLAAAGLGLGFQHLNQVTETIDRDVALGRAPRFAQRWHELTTVPHGRDLVAFRIGYPEREPNPSPRRALSDVIG